MSHGHRLRVPALALVIVVLLAVLSLPALAAGPKRIFITKSDENFNGQAGVTFELYEDTNGDGDRDDGEPLLQTKVTDAAGKATFDPVKPGKYVVREVTPAGYKDQPDKAVEIPDAKGKGPELVYVNEPKPANHRVNDPTGDTAVDGGTHVFDFGPTVATTPNGNEILVAWNDSTGFHPPGDVSGISTAFSNDNGVTWTDQVVGIPTGSQSNFYLGEPTTKFDPVARRFVVVGDSVLFAPQGLIRPIQVSTSGGQFGFWNNPVNTFPDIPPDPALAHGADLAVNPQNGNLYLAFTLSLGNQTSEAMLTRSTDGGATWGDPVSVSGVGAFDHADVEVTPKDRVYYSYSYYGDVQDPAYDIFFARSNDGGQTFGARVPIRQATAKGGTPGLCTGSATGRTVLGAAAVFNAGHMAVDPRNLNRIFFTYPAHGQGGDESDVFYSTSGDGGRTWSAAERVGPAAGTQWAPQVAVTPDGRVAFAYYQSQDGSTLDPTAAFYDPYSDEFVGEPESLTDGNAFELWNIDPSFDNDYGNCFGLVDPAVTAPGSGFFFAWTDGRDPGPAGNNGIDPNIYFANHLGPFLGTSTNLKVSTTASKVKASGDVAPQPLKGAIVSVTLFLDDGPGGFEQVASRQAKIDADGDYAASFGRPGGGTCRITVVFEGSEGRAPSPSKSQTFAC